MPPPVNVLISVPYLKSLAVRWLRHLGPRVSLLIDCGAFTTYSLGRPATKVEDYIKFINEFTASCGRYVNEFSYMALDVIGDGQATMANYEAMLDAGLSPIPIMTRGASDVEVQRFLDTSDHIAVGGVFGGTADKSALRAMVHRLPKGHKQHWLGFTNHDFVTYYRPHSVDASSWQTVRRYGKLSAYLGNGRFAKPVFYGKPVPANVRAAIRAVGDDPAKLAVRELWKPYRGTTDDVQCIQTRLMIRYARELQARVGTRWYFAVNQSVFGLGLVAHYYGAPCLCTIRLEVGERLLDLTPPNEFPSADLRDKIQEEVGFDFPDKQNV